MVRSTSVAPCSTRGSSLASWSSAPFSSGCWLATRWPHCISVVGVCFLRWYCSFRHGLKEQYHRKKQTPTTEMQCGQRVASQHPEENGADDHDASEDPRVEQGATEVDRTIDVEKVVQRQVRRPRDGAGQRWVPLCL